MHSHECDWQGDEQKAGRHVTRSMRPRLVGDEEHEAGLPCTEVAHKKATLVVEQGAYIALRSPDCITADLSIKYSFTMWSQRRTLQICLLRVPTIILPGNTVLLASRILALHVNELCKRHSKPSRDHR
jgi:hypothetical protein